MQKRKIISPHNTHTLDGHTCRIDWKNRWRIPNLWMETHGLHYGITAASACKECTNSEIL